MSNVIRLADFRPSPRPRALAQVVPLPRHLDPRRSRAQHAWHRLTHSPLARDLRNWAWLVTFLASLVAVLYVVDRIREAIA